MNEPSRMPPSPVPSEPSAESARLLRRRQRGNRAGTAGFTPGGVKLAVFRGMLRLIAATGRVPRSVRTATAHYGYGVRGRWFVTGSAEPANGTLLYVPGGGFVLPPVHDDIAVRFSDLTALPVLLAGYRLAPEHPFPAAADDVLAAYRSLLDDGIPAQRIRIAGDSSGGFLAAALLGDIRRSGLPMPAAVLLVSPLVDLSGRHARRCDDDSRDPATHPHFIEVTSAAYTAGTPLTDERLHVLGSDKHDWPPVLIQTGGTECLTAENELLAESIRGAGVTCELQLWPGQIHAFPLVGRDRIPEAAAAREYAARFLTG